MESLWSVITVIGDIRFWIIALLLITVYLRTANVRMSRRAKKRMMLSLILTFVIASLATQALKITVNVPRICTPCIASAADCNPYCPAEDPYAFPSGHAALAFGMFVSAWMLIPKRRKLAMSWILVLPVLVAYSRIALGVHTPEQVLAGVVVGIVSAVISYALLQRFNSQIKR
jgi:undecaprenyl-diphosphatase